MLRLTLGNGLLTNNSDSWLHQRRLIQPIFHRKQIAAFGQLMTESALAWTEEINIDTGQPLDLFQEMSGLTLNIVCKALFGADMLMHKERVFQQSGQQDRIRQFANPSLTGFISLCILVKYSLVFRGGFDIYAGVLLTPSCFLLRQ